MSFFFIILRNNKNYIKIQQYTQDLKVVPATVLLVSFICLKESTLETRKCFLFYFESSFRS